MKTSLNIFSLIFLSVALVCCTKELVYDGTANSEDGKENFVGDHQYVLIGGTKWATMNIGATTVAGSYETCTGDYFAWGEVSPRYNSKLKNENANPFYYWTFDFKTQYDSGYDPGNYVSPDGTSLGSKYDAATAIWGKSWRIPTREEFLSLAAACGGKKETKQTFVQLSAKVTEGGIYMVDKDQMFEPEYHGVSGILFVSRKDITKRVFFPAVGEVTNNDMISVEKNGKYCSSDASKNNMCYTFSFHLNSLVQMDVVSVESHGYTIRPVVK